MIIRNNQAGVSLILTFFTAFYIFFIRRVQAMNNARKFKILKPEEGVSLILTFFIMVIILAIVLSISVLLYSEVKVLRNIGNSVASYYAAESGIEKVLYYDRQVRPLVSTTTPCPTGTECPPDQVCNNGFCASAISRGLCSIPTTCSSDSSTGSTGEHSIFCNSTCPGNTCNPAQFGVTNDCTNCTDCSVLFNTSFGSSDGRTYSVTASVDSNNYLVIESRGTFNGTERQIRTTISTQNQP